jgi:hypothetical protein
MYLKDEAKVFDDFLLSFTPQGIKSKQCKRRAAVVIPSKPSSSEQQENKPQGQQ